MKKNGKVIKYNGNFGTIYDNNDRFYFSKRDLDSKDIIVGDLVEFREEIKELDLHIARNVKVLVKNKCKK